MYRWNGLLDKPEYKCLFEHESLGKNICLLTVGGSHAYGLANEDSDIDIRGIATRTDTDILGLTHFEGFNKATNDTDIQIYTFDKFVRLAIKGNVNILEILFGDFSNVLICDGVGKQLLDKKNMFLSNDIYKSLRGTIYSHLKSYEKTGNEKFLRHVARLTAMAHDLFLNGEFIVEVDKMTSYRDIWQILSSETVKNGGIEAIKAFCDNSLDFCLDNSILNDHVNQIMAESLIIGANRNIITGWWSERA